MEKETSLALACFRLGVSYDKGRRMLLTGVLNGRQHNGRWMVTEESIERALEQSARPQFATA
jgi:hypothetical protein